MTDMTTAQLVATVASAAVTAGGLTTASENGLAPAP